MAIIPGILWREDYLRQKLRIPIDWDTEAAPMGCCFGTTGSGKTYAVKLLCGKLVKYGNAKLTVCDGKGGGDFDFLKGCDRYAAIDVTAVFDRFYNSFLARQRGEDESRDIMCLLFDEWSAYLDGLDEKKQMEAQRKKLGQLLRLGRSFRTHVLLSQQRMDSTYFQGFRENFNLVIGLSNLSKESRDMFFSEYKEQMEPDRARGTGYMTVNGASFTPVAVPKVNDLDKLHRAILAGVTR
jgi:DNA segregation ATPase FtsK/SpoIIIE and related proteins